jgi:predicted nucleotidyltransferase
MGGGGGSFGSGFDPSDIAKQVREAESKIEHEEFNRDLEKVIASLLSDYNSRDKDLVRRRMDEILKVLGPLAEGELDMVFGGSVAKHTYIEGLSDIDCLLIVNDPGLDKSDPRNVLDKVAGEIETKLEGKATAEPGNLAVTVRYRDGMEIQLVPAIRTEAGVKIPSSRTARRWSAINPENFREALTKYNARCAGKLVPTIKLAKAIIAQLPDAHQLSGYHIESLAIDAFKGYRGSKTPAAMLPYFFEHAKDRVLRPMTDSTGQSVHVDEYMGNEGSPARVNASHLLGRIWRRMASASAAGSIPQWKDLLGEDE